MSLLSIIRACKKTAVCVPVQLGSKCLSTDAPFPSIADVVVIGGGNAGCNVLYQLAKKNIRAVLLEYSKVGSATSSFSAGILWNLRPDDLETALLKITNQVVQELAQEGLDLFHVRNGSLFLARRQERVQEFANMRKISWLYGVACDVLMPDEAVRIFPTLKASSFHAALHCPLDGSLDSVALCKGLAKMAKEKGAQIFEKTTANRVLLNPDTYDPEVAGINTSRGVIKTKRIVNAAGIWSNQLFEPIGIRLPFATIKHGFVITERVPEVGGTPNLQDPDVFVHYKTVGETLYMGYYEHTPKTLKKMLPKATNDRGLDADTLQDYIRTAALTNPVMETVRIRNTVCGIEAYTIDGRPIFGEDPRITGLYHMCAFNGMGTMLAGGCAQHLATCIHSGCSNLHMPKFDIARFMPFTSSYKRWVAMESASQGATEFSSTLTTDEKSTMTL